MTFTSYSGRRYRYEVLTNSFYESRRFTDETSEPNRNSVKMLFPFDRDALEAIIRSKIGFLCITITEVCNMRCRYCTYSGDFHEHRTHSNRSISLENGKAIIDWLYTHSSDIEKVGVGFYGGEVLTSFRLLKMLTEYAKDRFGNRLRSISFTTNGTLLDSEIIEWIAAEKYLWVSVTVNGSRIIHDRNRVYANGHPTYDNIIKNLTRLRDRMGYGDFAERVTVLANFSDWRERDEILSCINNNEILKSCRVDCTQIDYPENWQFDKETTRSAAIADSEYRQKMERDAIYSSCESDKEFKQYEERLVRAGIKIERIRQIHFRNEGRKDKIVYYTGCCVPFANRLVVDLDGNLRFCESADHVMPLGNILHEGVSQESINKVIELDKYLNAFIGCSSCVNRYFCSLCFREFLDGNGYREVGAIKRECERMSRKIRREFSIYVSIAEAHPEYLASLKPPKERPWLIDILTDGVYRKKQLGAE